MDNVAALIIGPSIAAVVSIAAVIVNVIISKRNARTADSAVGVSQQNADTNEFDILRQGFMTLIEGVQLQAKADRDKSASELLKLSQRIDEQAAKKDLIIAHVLTLEAMIPFPPGPPARPDWI